MKDWNTVRTCNAASSGWFGWSGRGRFIELPTEEFTSSCSPSMVTVPLKNKETDGCLNFNSKNLVKKPPYG